MSSAKSRRRKKRRAERITEQAWEALERGNHSLADRLSYRSVMQGPMNARLWKEHAEILESIGKSENAIKAARRALVLSRGYEEARLLLSRLQGEPEQAGEPGVAEDATEAREVLTPVRTASYDWEELSTRMVQDGAVRISGLLTGPECDHLRSQFEEDRFEHRVEINDERGVVAYKFFRRPLPTLVQDLREELYFRAAILANVWQAKLGDCDKYPPTLRQFLARCRAVGQVRPAPILLRYPLRGFNALHRDVPGRLTFPIQCAISLGPHADDGGEFLLADEGPGRKKRLLEIATCKGDAVLFASRARLCKIGSVYGLQSVRHGVKSVLAEERYALGLPFHDYPQPAQRSDKQGGIRS